MVLYLNENIIEEAISGSEVIKALDNRQGVVINYNDDTNTARTGRRYIEPYVYGLTKAGNPCIRAYQYYGDTKRGVPKWKMFRLDRIDSWEPTEETFDIEPQARGWVAQAYNDNGDASMSQIFKTVDLEQEPQSEYEKLKAKTRRLKNSKPLTLDQFKGKLQYPEEQNKPSDITNPQLMNVEDLRNNDAFQAMLRRNLEITNQEKLKRAKPKHQPISTGPINGEKPNDNIPSPVTSDIDNTSGPINGSGNLSTDSTPPVKPTESNEGPILDAQSSTPEELMSNDKFREMLKRNLEISNQEKNKRKRK